MSRVSEVRKLVRQLRREGWAAEFRGSSHILLTHPSGQTLTLASSPSDRRWLANVRADVRRIERISTQG